MNNTERLHYINPETWSNEELKPSSFVYELISNGLKGKQTPDQTENLNDVYKTFSILNSELIHICKELENRGLINKEYGLYFVTFISTAKFINPELDFIYKNITTGGAKFINPTDIVFITDPVIENFIRDMVVLIQNNIDPT